MTLALSALDPTIQGLFFLIATIVFVIAAILARPALWACLVGIGLGCCALVWAWNAFAFAG